MYSLLIAFSESSSRLRDITLENKFRTNFEIIPFCILSISLNNKLFALTFIEGCVSKYRRVLSFVIFIYYTGAGRCQQGPRSCGKSLIFSLSTGIFL